MSIRVWTQNTILRPNILPQNTAADNAERMKLIVEKIRADDFDVVALQEVFDGDQQAQLSNASDLRDYVVIPGPSQAIRLEDSGLSFVVRRSLVGDQGAAAAHNETFADCAGVDCLAGKGFTVTTLSLGEGRRLHIVNTHLQASYGDLDSSGARTRLRQLEQIMRYLDRPAFAPHPVLLLGDVNVAAGDAEYRARRADVLAGWRDLVAETGGERLFTVDKDLTQGNGNAYAHFWDIRRIGEPRPRGPRKRVDYLLARPGKKYTLKAGSVRLEDQSRLTEMCSGEFGLADGSDLNCYLSDHYGISAQLGYIALADDP